MKKSLIILSGLALSLSGLSALGDDAVREIKMEVKSVGGKTIWSPEKVEVHPGDTVKFVLEDKLPGKEFHGFMIAPLKVTEKVDLDKPAKTVEVKIPKDAKLGDMKIACQFHPTHLPSTLSVTPAPTQAKK